MQADTPIYASLSHALSRAFGEPMDHYGKALADSGVMRVVERLAPDDQMTQDGMTLAALREHLMLTELMILYLIHDGTKNCFHTRVALDMFVGIFSRGFDEEFTQESIVRWTGRRLLKEVHTLGEWGRRYNRPAVSLRDRRILLRRHLDEILSVAEVSAAELLTARGLIP